ncbi:MAG: Sodium/glucose cotransporter [Candidatus Anoxychlamydiales bacterium]|nr:Sodium/glucose cotransporter [Candidatus Anoxychlamydiales bacterium]
MNIPFFLVMIALLGSIYIWIGKRSSKDVETNDDYFLMGRKLNFFQLSLTLLATQVGGGSLLGAAQEAYQKGWIVLFYPLGACLGLFALGMGFGGKLRKLNISTIAEIFEKIYKSRHQRFLASGLSIVALFFILVAQGIAAQKFFIGMNLQSPIIFILFWAILIAYTVMGGLKAVVNTDILQALFILITLGFAFFSINFSNIAISNPQVSQNMEISSVPWVTWLFMPLLFMLIEQDMGQRCFAAKKPKVISASAIVAGILLLASSSIAIYFGVLAKKLGIQALGNASILIESVKALTNPLVATLFMGAIFMAVISTADSILCSIGSNLSYDFLVSKKISEKNQVRISRMLTLITGLGSLGLVYIFDNVVTMLMLAYELSVCILFVPIIAALLSKNPSRLGAYLSMASGAIGFGVFRFISVPIPKEVLTISLSFIGYMIGRQIDSQKAYAKQIQED